MVVGGVGSGKTSLLMALLGEMRTLKGQLRWTGSVLNVIVVTSFYKTVLDLERLVRGVSAGVIRYEYCTILL